MLKIAIALNKNRELHKDHFGDSVYYQIYKLENNAIRLEKEIINSHKNNDENHEHGDNNKANKISKKLGPIDVLFAGAFGHNIKIMKEKYIIVSLKEIIPLEDALSKLEKISEKLQSLVNNNNKEIIILD